MTQFIDSTKPPREGEALDVDRLAEYLDEKLGGAQPIEVEQFRKGHSNLTYLVRRGASEYVLRRPPFGSKVRSAHDMGREYNVLSKLAPHYAKAPAALVSCTDESVIGAEFYLMQRIRGVILRKSPPAGLTIDENTARKLSLALVDALAELHCLDYEALGLGDLGKPAGYVERQISGWTKRYAGSQTDDIDSVTEISTWLADNMPADNAPALIHNDFKFDNLVLDPDDITQVIGILDWEMATIGDPLMDLGTALCYWVEDTDPQPMQMMRFGPTTLPGMLRRRALAERWAEKTGRDISNMVFYYCFGLFKTAVVVQQIYYRYVQGKTKDERFATFIRFVGMLAEKAAEAAARGSI